MSESHATLHRPQLPAMQGEFALPLHELTALYALESVLEFAAGSPGPSTLRETRRGGPAPVGRDLARECLAMASVLTQPSRRLLLPEVTSW
jgi:hypothetical protein